MSQPYPLLRNHLAETLAAGGLAVALIVQKMAMVDMALAAKTCGCDAISAMPPQFFFVLRSDIDSAPDTRGGNATDGTRGYFSDR